MITDNNLQLSGSWAAGVWTPQAITAASTLSTNVVDLASMSPNQPIDLGMGDALEIAIAVAVAPTTPTSVEFQMVTADDAAITTNIQVVVSTQAIVIASLPLGRQIVLHVDRSAPYIARRYLALRYVVVGTVTTSGSYIAEIVKSVGDLQNTQYKAGYAVL